MDTVMIRLEILRRWWRNVGPYLVLEILLPGGTLFALLLFLYRRSKLGEPLMRQRAVRPVPVLARVVDHIGSRRCMPTGYAQASRNAARSPFHAATCAFSA